MGRPPTKYHEDLNNMKKRQCALASTIFESIKFKNPLV